MQADGNILLYDLFGNYLKSISMGKDASDVGILDGKVFTTSFGTSGVVVMTTNFRFYMVTNIHDAKVRQMADLPGINQLPPSCWTVLNHSLTSHILVARQHELSLVDITGVKDKPKPQLSSGAVSFTEVAVSFDSKFLALFTSSGVLWLGSADFKNTICEFDTENPCRPTRLSWCGSEAVVAVWQEYVLLVGVNKEVSRFDYDSQVHMVLEIDGVRLISQTSHDLLQRVPNDLLDVFMFGSEAPGALLFEAFRLFQEGKKDAHEYLKMIGGGLEGAIESCVQASGHEFDSSIQKLLLRAASFGRSFLAKGMEGGRFEEACRRLRVLSALRGVGVPLTIVQLDSLTTEVVVNRLMNRGLYWLAYELVSYLNLPPHSGIHHVLNCWACNKIEDVTCDEEHLSKTICSKLQQHPDAPFSTIINHAILHRKQHLALNLIDHDPHISSQVPLLLKLNLESKALEKALLSGDSDLVYLVLMQWKDKLQHGEFLRSVRLFPAAFSLYKQYCRQQNREMLMEIHYQEDDHQEEAVARLVLSYDEERFDRRISWLLSAKEAFDKAKNDVYSKLTEDQIKLLRLQKRWEEEGVGEVALMHLSLEETFSRLIGVGDQHPQSAKCVEVLKKEFKVAEKRFWWIKLQTLAEIGKWEELEGFAKSKKSPIGYEPFMQVCVRQGNTDEALKYISKVPQEQLVKCYVILGDFEKAASLALQSGRDEDVDVVMARCQDKQVLQRLQAGRKR